MVLVRFEPGSEVPSDGSYLLCGHFGEISAVGVNCEQGEVLPLISSGAAASLERPLAYVRAADLPGRRAAIQDPTDRASPRVGAIPDT
jgi:hypothetical protein